MGMMFGTPMVNPVKKRGEFLYKDKIVLYETETERNSNMQGQGTSLFSSIRRVGNLIGYQTEEGIKEIPAEETVAIKKYIRKHHIL